jgi:hypothetical protein
MIEEGGFQMQISKGFPGFINPTKAELHHVVQFIQEHGYGSSPYSFPTLIAHSYFTQQGILVVKPSSYPQSIIAEFRIAKLLANLSKSLKV